MTDFSEQERIRISIVIMDILDNWKVEDKDKVSLLGLPAETRSRSLRKYREDTPFPNEPAVWERLQHFAGIDDALHTSYPRNPHMAGMWMHRKNTRFGDRTPLICMLEDGMVGINAVHMHLDCSYDWHIDQKQADIGQKK
ncbi:MAG: DUF2384 domain-containing protein [Acidiferrobacterales bacterium]